MPASAVAPGQVSDPCIATGTRARRNAGELIEEIRAHGYWDADQTLWAYSGALVGEITLSPGEGPEARS
jgi:hypothetical protein